MKLRNSFTVITITCVLHFYNVQSLPLLVKNPSYRNPFVGFFVLPHGGITLDPEDRDYSGQAAFHGEVSKKKSVELHNAMREAAKSLVKLKPDLIIFSTPHGYSLNDNAVIVSAKSAYGNAGGFWKDFTAGFGIQSQLSGIIYSELKGANDSIEILGLGSGNEPMDLLWAEVIPFYFIQKAAKQANFTLPPVVYIGQASGVSNTKLVDIGRDIVKTTLLRKEFANKRIAVLVSGDLSHYHANDTTSPYPYSPISKVFDEYIVNWAKMDRNAQTENNSGQELLSKAAKISGQAGHCGYTGLVMLHGMLEEAVNQNWNYKSHFYTYQVPSYFGMMVASWLPAN